MINMKDDKFYSKTNRDFINQNQKSFMSDSVDDRSKDVLKPTPLTKIC